MIEAIESVDVAGLIKTFCEENSEEYRFYENYSGRNMDGRQCVGIVTKNNSLKTIIALCDFLRGYDIVKAENALGTVAQDNLGKDIIIYFPSIMAEKKKTEKKKECEKRCDRCDFWKDRGEHGYGLCTCPESPTYNVRTVFFHMCTMK